MPSAKNLFCHDTTKILLSAKIKLEAKNMREPSRLIICPATFSLLKEIFLKAQNCS